MNRIHTSKSATRLLAAGWLVLSATAWAQATEEQNDRFPINVAAMEAKAEAMYARIDSNADGLISAEEFAAHQPERSGHGDKGRRWHQGVPGRGEPGVRQSDPARHAAFEAELFKAMDQDGNGSLSAAEFADRQDVRRSLMQQHAFTRLDANSDGVLDRDEFPPRRLAGLDTNGDGEISREEMRSRYHDKRSNAG